MPSELPTPFSPTRDFWTAVFQSKIEATIGEEGQMIGWEEDNNTVGPKAAKAKQSLLRFIPHMLPSGPGNGWLYRPVLEHGDFGIHNMSIAVDARGKPLITSLYDWETGCIVPALLADPEMAVAVDLTADENGQSRITRVGSDETAEYRDEYIKYTDFYLTVRVGLSKTQHRAYYLTDDETGVVQRSARVQARYMCWQGCTTPLVRAEEMERRRSRRVLWQAGRVG
jgi:aminoglycoside phosphotransferase (APT) family kinase protein